MNQQIHVDSGAVSRLRRGELTPVEVLEVTGHLSGCEACRTRESRARGVVEELVRDSANDHPDAGTTLVRFVDDDLPFDERARVEAHLDLCDRCRGDVDDLRKVAATIGGRGGRRYTWLIAAAAVIVAAIIGLLLLRPAAEDQIQRPQPIQRPVPVPEKPSPLKPEWKALIDETMRRGRIPMPQALREIDVSQETVRGSAKARRDAVAPAEQVVESNRPEFTWPAQSDAIAVVSVYRDDDEIANSGPVRGNTWTPAKPLPRGVPLVWQVEVRTGDGAKRIVPSPPDPPAIFRVLDAASLREIEEAQRLEPHNDLLLGVLYARAGMKNEAVDALRRANATKLLESIRKW